MPSGITPSSFPILGPVNKNKERGGLSFPPTTISYKKFFKKSSSFFKSISFAKIYQGL